MTDVTDSTFESDVLDRSEQTVVLVDLWAPWCGPCRTLGPILEKVVADRDGVELVKVNVDDNPQTAGAFQVQSIPAVFAMRDRKVVDGFIGALPEPAVIDFVDRLVITPSQADRLVAIGDEPSLRQALDLEPGHQGAVVALARLLADDGRSQEALDLLARIPETPESRQVAAEARLALQNVEIPSDGIEEVLDGLLDRVRTDDGARQEFLDLLETLPPEDPRITSYRRSLASRLF
jgi:putative thioredoxin